MDHSDTPGQPGNEDLSSFIHVLVVPYGAFGDEVAARMGSHAQILADHVGTHIGALPAMAQREWREFAASRGFDLPPVAIVPLLGADDADSLATAYCDVQRLRAGPNCSSAELLVMPVLAPWRGAETRSSDLTRLIDACGTFVWTGHHPDVDAAVRGAATAAAGLVVPRPATPVDDGHRRGPADRAGSCRAPPGSPGCAGR